MKLPRRTTNLIEQDVDGELVVYDPVRGQAHFLNDTLALVYRRCDGRHTTASVARELPLDSPRAASEDAVRMAVDQLTKSGLVAEKPSRDAGPSRREFLRRWGKAAVAIPAITSVVAALPVSAASACVVNGSTGGCVGGNVCSPCTDAGAPDGQCATDFCGALFNSTGTSCLDDTFGGFACFNPNGGAIQQSCAAARAAAGGGLYGCCVCP